jgi:hypothetical protein
MSTNTKTVEVEVDASELKGDEAKLFEKLSDYLKEKTGGEVSTNAKAITIKGQGPALAKKYVRVTLKKFLHKHGLTEQYKVIASEESLKIKERKFFEEED